MQVWINGYDLPGRAFCAADGVPYDDVHVGVQIRRVAEFLVPGDADSASWNIGVEVISGPEGELDFRGPAVHGRRGDRFLYLTWGNVSSNGEFDMFRRAKLMLNRIDSGMVLAADAEQGVLAGRVRLSDDHGTPRCARVDPPDLEWTIR